MQVVWADGRKEYREVNPAARRLIVPVSPTTKLGECHCMDCWASRLRRIEFLREVTAIADDAHGPFESFVAIDEETGQRYMLRYREELPS